MAILHKIIYRFNTLLFKIRAWVQINFLLVYANEYVDSCTCAHACRTRCLCLCLFLSAYFLKTRSLVNLKLTALASLASQHVPRVHLSPSPYLGIYRYAQPCLIFFLCEYWGLRLRSSCCLQNKRLYPLSHLPSPYYIFL